MRRSKRRVLAKKAAASRSSPAKCAAWRSAAPRPGASMDEIVSSVRRVTDLMAEIAASSSEQRDGIGQVNTAVNQLDQMTQQNAALVEESAAAAGSLRDQAQRLSEVVSVFNVGSARDLARHAIA